MSCLPVTRVDHAAILNAYDDRAASYSRLAIVQRGLAHWLAEWLEHPRVAAWQTAIEFGAGDGLFTRFAAERYANFVATDISPRMVEQGRGRLPHVNWQVADAWNYAGPAADRLFSASLLQWCADPERVLREWRACAPTGARMLHGFYVSPTLAEWYSIAGDNSPLEWRTSDRWSQLFHEAGWSILRSETRRYIQEFASGLDLIRFLRHTGATCGSSPSITELRRRIATYEREFPAKCLPGGVTSTWTMFRIEATTR